MYYWRARALMSGLQTRKAYFPCTMLPSMHSPCVPTIWQRQLHRRACRRTVQGRRQQMQQQSATRARCAAHEVFRMPAFGLEWLLHIASSPLTQLIRTRASAGAERHAACVRIDII